MVLELALWLLEGEKTGVCQCMNSGISWPARGVSDLGSAQREGYLTSSLLLFQACFRVYVIPERIRTRAFGSQSVGLKRYGRGLCFVCWGVGVGSVVS